MKDLNVNSRRPESDLWVIERAIRVRWKLYESYYTVFSGLSFMQEELRQSGSLLGYRSLHKN